MIIKAAICAELISSEVRVITRPIPSRLQENAEQALVAVTHCVAKGEPLPGVMITYWLRIRRCMITKKGVFGIAQGHSNRSLAKAKCTVIKPSMERPWQGLIDFLGGGDFRDAWVNARLHWKLSKRPRAMLDTRHGRQQKSSDEEDSQRRCNREDRFGIRLAHPCTGVSGIERGYARYGRDRG